MVSLSIPGLQSVTQNVMAPQISLREDSDRGGGMSRWTWVRKMVSLALVLTATLDTDGALSWAPTRNVLAAPDASIVLAPLVTNTNLA
jgi:hypothetical protein